MEMAQASADKGNDPQAKIRYYQDQLEQVESALTIDPSHEDLGKIKHDLHEIIRILNNQLPLPIEDWEPEDESETNNMLAEDKIKTDVKEIPDEIVELASSYVSAKKERASTTVKLGGEDDSEEQMAVPSSSNSGGHTPDLEDYLSFRNDKGQAIPSIAHRDFRDITDRSLKNYLNKQKKKMREQEIKERAAQGLPPILQKRKQEEEFRRKTYDYRMQKKLRREAEQLEELRQRPFMSGEQLKKILEREETDKDKECYYCKEIGHTAGRCTNTEKRVRETRSNRKAGYMRKKY